MGKAHLQDRKLTRALTLTYRLQVQPNKDAPGQARRFVARRTPETKRDYVALVVSELVTNAVIHRSSDQPIDVLLQVADRELLVEVQQPGPTPIATKPSQPIVGGRGLAIVAALASTWGTGPSSVWARFAL